MNSSGIKRGLAGSAITALAITGLPFLATSANADSLAAQQGATDGVTLQSPEFVASVENDGSESTVHLVATGGSDVQQVRFEFQNAGGTWVPIATVSRNAGAFSTEWAPPPATYNSTVPVRAVALGSVGTEIGTPDTNNVDVDADADAIDIAYTPGAEVGVYQQDYGTEGQTALLGAVSGTTSDLAADPTLTFESNTGAPTTSEDVAGKVETGDTSRTYSAPVDFTGYSFDTTAPIVNEALILAQAEGEDAEPVNIYKQSISGVTATAKNSNVQGSTPTDITVKVTDSKGNPIVGAQVVAEDAVTGANSGGAVEYTNSQGQAVFEGATGSANGTTYDFYVNTTDTDAYENGVDFRRSVTVGNYTAAPTTITVSSKDGKAFDVDENAAGDLRVRVLDQNGNPVNNQTVSYSLAVDLFPPATGPAPANPAPTTGNVTTGTDGYANIPFTDKGDGEYTLSAYVNLDGTPGQGAGDLSAQDFVFKAGDAELEFDDVMDNAAGTTATYDATLALVDGTPLAGRKVRFTYTANGDDVVVAAQGAQPNGTERISNTVADAVTGNDGSASVALSDPANTPTRSELDGELDAASVTNSFGNAGADADEVEVNFVTDEVDGTAVVKIAENTATGKPGEVTSGTVKVTVDDPDTTAVENDPAANVLVTLKVDGDAFFTTMGGEPANPEEGDQAGDIVDRGQTITVVTDSTGNATYYIGIKGSDDFDDDGEATVNVTATVDGQSDTEDYDFSSENPLNGGDVIIELASDKFQDSSVLPKLPLSDTAAYDVQATDQFGNPVENVDVDIDIDGVGDADPISVRTDFNDNVEFAVDSNVAGDSMPVGTWDAPVNEYNDLGVVVPDSEDIEGEGPEVEFYAVDFANSTFTLAQQGPETVPVGTTVIMDYTAVDQNGEPIEFSVDFFRTGPDDFQDGDPNNPTPVATGEDGMATYVFSGAAEGTATVTAIGYVGATVVPASQATDTVSFGRDDETPKAEVEAIISGDSNGGKKDVVRFQVDDAAEGADVQLFKIRGTKAKGNKRLVQVRSDIVPEGGTLTFKVADRNGNQKTRFVAKVAEGDNNLAAKSNTQKLR